MRDLTVLAAERFAQMAHRGQKRKYTGEPYFNHCYEVAGLVRKVEPDNRDTIVAALLHDVVEDTTYTAADIQHLFGDTVAEMVVALSNTPVTPGLNRAQRKALDIKRLAAAHGNVHTVKLADMISNTRDIIRYDPDFAKLYMAEKRDLLEALTRGNHALYAQAKKQVGDYFDHLTSRGDYMRDDIYAEVARDVGTHPALYAAYSPAAALRA